MPFTLRRVSLLCTVCLVFFAGPWANQATALKRAVVAKNRLEAMQTPAPTGRVVIKFNDASEVLVKSNGLACRRATTLTRLGTLLAQVAPGSRLTRHFSRPEADLDQERLRAETRSGRSLPNLNRYGRLELPVAGDDRAALLEIVRRLAADPAVETAFLEPVAVPATLGFDAFTGEFQAPGQRSGSDRAGPATPLPPVTPDFSGLQGYLGPAPDGIGAMVVSAIPGASAPNVQVIDVEGAWLWDHEDLPSPFVTLGTQFDSIYWRNHGTAVLGEIRGTDNGIGVRGIVPDCSVGSSSINDQSPAEAIINAAAELQPGDIILIELHAPGPNANGSGQFGYIAMEFWQDNFDAILLATAAGVIVCEAAGNGEQNLDDPVYQDLFDRSVRDSGAIICGATNGASLQPAWFTNHGTRVDLSGWGFNVTTCGYGHLQGDPDFPEEEWYTDSFSGTSSASPIVVGAVASLQGLVQATFGMNLDAGLARHILVLTGTPTSGPELIGPRPDLEQAWVLANDGIGEVAGTVTDLVSGLPVSRAKVLIAETGAFDLTAVDGSYRIPLLVGTYTLEFSSYFHYPLTDLVAVNHGAVSTVDAALNPVPTVTLQGRVFGPNNDPLGNVQVTPLDVPLPATATDPTGWFEIPSVPQNRHYNLFFDRYLGTGAAFKVVDTFNNPGPPDDYIWVGLPAVTEDFEGSGGGFVPSNDVWSHGTPQAGGPEGSGFSGEACWGVGMTGNYEDDVIGLLTSPVYDFSGGSISNLYLSFHFWAETESGFDGVYLEAFNGSNWQHWDPLEDYTDLSLGGLGYESGWSGNSGGWRGTVFFLNPFLGPDFQFRLVFGSDFGVNGPGFWIDDIAFDTGGLLTAVDSPATPTPAHLPTLAAFPNPFNPQATIAWQIPEAGGLAINVFDLRGRRLRELFRGQVATNTGRVSWDGTDADGQLAAAGVYLVQLRLEDGTTVSRRVMLAK